MELEIHIECPDRKDVIKIPTFMELQIDLDRSQKQWDIKLIAPVDLQIGLMML